MFQTKRTYLLNKGEKTPFRKVVILEKLLLCEMSSSTVNNMRSHQTLRNINHFIGGHNLFQTKRTYLLNKAEKRHFTDENSNCIEITTLRKRYKSVIFR